MNKTTTIAPPIKAINWRIQPVACDCCDRPLPRPGVFWSKREREMPFTTLPYVICSDCSEQDEFDPLEAIIRRAKRHSEKWCRSVRMILSHCVPEELPGEAA